LGNLMHKRHVWVVQHHMEMLNIVHGLQRPPVLEPYHLCYYYHTGSTVSFMARDQTKKV
jgi:hypothetical protein